jgi:signal transduction histidine kinase
MRLDRHHLEVTKVTLHEPMSTPRLSDTLIAMLRDMDPRRSLVARIIWLMIALAASFAIAASIWAGRVAREIVLQQHVRRLALETDQLASDLGQAVGARLDALRAAGNPAGAAGVFERLTGAYPDLGWVAVADAEGTVLAADASLAVGSSVRGEPWFSGGLNGPWIGVIRGTPRAGRTPLLGDLSAPVTDASGRVVAVIAAHLNWHWAPNDVQRLNDTLNPRGSAQTLVLDGTGKVLVGPDALLGKRWEGIALEEPPPIEPDSIESDSIAGPADPGPTESGPAADAPSKPSATPLFERLPDGAMVVVARAPMSVGARHPTLGWQVQLSESREHVYQRANALAIRILWISICLGTATALIGALGARHLTNRLRRLTRSAAAVGRNEMARIEVPKGRDEVAQLAAAFAEILDALRQERTELLTLSSELERRVAVRTREVERLAEESRYAAVVRERLKIARDLHDTLAHSMMAMLSEVRLLRKLQVHDPDSLREELARAEEVAHEGLNEARTAITQMRVNAVRDTGLGAALRTTFDRFIDRTALSGEFTADPDAAGFGDERAETLFRMAEEAMRNIERHAMAAHASLTLKTIDGTHLQLSIEDDGIGFDPATPHQGHYGLIGLHEQAQLIGAHLLIDSAPGRGTTLIVTLRMPPEEL